jgi:hypothetical protein
VRASAALVAATGLVAASPARADREPRTLLMTEPAHVPFTVAIAANAAACRAGTGANLVRDGELVIGPTKVWSARECMTDE